MDRREFLMSAVTFSLLAAPLAAGAEPVQRSAHIGLLAPAGRGEDIEGFLRGMHELGYVEGRNLVLEYRSADGKAERLPELLAELVRLKVDLIMTGGTAAALAAKQVVTTVPVVIGAMGDPVESGVVSSLAHPGGNITGLSMEMSEGFTAKYLELIRQIVPRASWVAVLWHPSMRTQVQGMERAASSLGIRLQSFAVQEPGQLDGVFAAMATQHAAAVVVTNDPFSFTHRKEIVRLAVRHRLPAVYGLRAFVRAGGLLAYGPDLSELWRRGATYVDKIVRGAKPADLPVQQPTKFELVINLTTAKALGVTIPPSLLLRADEVIQ